MNLINKHPLDTWQSVEVAELLADFFAENYILAGISKEEARNFVLTIFEEKNTKNWNLLLEQSAQKLLSIQKRMVKMKHPENDPLSVIDFSQTKTFLDVGANKLSAINFLAKKHKNIEKFIAVDIIPQHTDFMFPQKSEYIQINPNSQNYPLPENSVDTILAQYVFHHFANEEQIVKTLRSCFKILKPNGQFVLMEESFTHSYIFNAIKTNKEVLNILTNEELTKRFYKLSDEKKWEFILANDWLINVNNPHMQWTGQYRTWENWVKLLSENCFSVSQSYNLGIRVNGRLKQGVHIIGIFEKT